MGRARYCAALNPAGLGHFSFAAPQSPIGGSVFTSQVVISQLHEAVERARHGRHHATCHCGLFRHGDGTYCSAEEWRWSRIIDRLLSQVCQREANCVSTAIPDENKVC